jgi:hypothetical protein
MWSSSCWDGCYRVVRTQVLLTGFQGADKCAQEFLPFAMHRQVSTDGLRNLF